MSSRQRTHKPGQWLIYDDLSGIAYWSSEVGKDWDGSYRQIERMDGQHPDYVAKTLPLEKFPDRITSEQVVTAYSNTRSDFIGNTTVLRDKTASPDDFLFDP